MQTRNEKGLRRKAIDFTVKDGQLFMSETYGAEHRRWVLDEKNNGSVSC